MRLLVVSSMVSVILSSCHTGVEPKRIISVGMPWTEAESALKDSNAGETALAVDPETETDVIKSYALADGSVLLIRVTKKDARVSRLEVCSNPEEPKGARIWKTVSTLDPK